MKMLRALLCLPWLAAALPSKQAAAANPNEGWTRVAVVAASNQGLSGDRPLRYAYRDGERLEKMLGTVGQIEPENLFLLKVETKAELQTALTAIGRRIAGLKEQNRKVFLQFYYSGHGGAHYFHFRDGRLGFDEVKQALGGDQADARVYVLDVCFGASFFTAKGFRTAPPVQLQLEMDRAAKGEVTISSSSGDEQAYEVRNLGGSIFTSHWIMALRGAGDVNRDGQVTLFEAYNYAYDRTAGYSAETLDRPQHPAYQIDLTGARDVMLARLLRSTTGILFQKCPAGLYNLLDLQRGMQIGELRIPEGEDFTLALEPGRYRVQFQPAQGNALAADLELPAAAMTPLPFAAFLPQAPGAGTPKGTPEDLEPRDPAPSADADDGLAGSVRPPPRPPSQPSLLARTGYAAWIGLGIFADGSLETQLAKTPEPDRYFHFTGAFQAPLLTAAWGMNIDLPLLDGWNTALQFGFSHKDYHWNSTGVEPLHSVSDSLRGAYPVNLSWTYRFSDFRLGAVIGRNIKVTPSNAVGIDGSAAWVSRRIRGEHRVERPLYQSSTLDVSESLAGGFQLETGLTWRTTLPAVVDGRPLALGLRLAPYFCKLDPVDSNTDPMALDSREFGFTASLVFNLQGRRAAAGR